MTESNEIESSRKALLKFYSSQTMTHGGYIIALTVGFLTLVSRWDAFAETIGLRCMFYLMFSLIMSIGIYITGRTLYWACLSHTILGIAPKSLTSEPVISQLNRITGKWISENTDRYGWYRLANHFNQLTTKKMCVFFSLSVFIFLFLLVSDIAFL